MNSKDNKIKNKVLSNETNYVIINMLYYLWRCSSAG